MLDAAMQTQLKTYLANLREPIELVASLGDDAKSAQTRELLTEIAALHDMVSAKFDGMPLAAAATGMVDHVHPPRDISRVLCGLPPLIPPIASTPISINTSAA